MRYDPPTLPMSCEQCVLTLPSACVHFSNFIVLFHSHSHVFFISLLAYTTTGVEHVYYGYRECCLSEVEVM